LKVNLVSIISEQHQPDVYSRVLPLINDLCAMVELEAAQTVVLDELLPDVLSDATRFVGNNSVVLCDSGTFAGFESLKTALTTYCKVPATTVAFGYVLHTNSGTMAIVDLNTKDLLSVLTPANFKKAFAYEKAQLLLRMFGANKAQIGALIESMTSNTAVTYNISSNSLESTVVLHAPTQDYKNTLNNISREIYNQFGEQIFADSYTSLYFAVEDLLNFRKKKLAIADSLTNGILLSELKAGFAKFDNTVISFKQIARKPDYFSMLKLVEAQVDAMGENIELAYEMGAKLLAEHPNAIVVVLCGTYKKPFIAVGDSGGIHVYKFSLNAGERFIAELLSKNAIFKIIKKLKQNDLYFYDSSI